MEELKNSRQEQDGVDIAEHPYPRFASIILRYIGEPLRSFYCKDTMEIADEELEKV